MRKIGIFGTTADPFTECHMAIIDKVIDDGLVDTVMIVPTIVDYHRQGKTKWLSNDQKYYIINRALFYSNNSNKIIVDRSEWNYSEIHSPFVNSERRFIHTLSDLVWYNTHTDDDYRFYTIIGTDSLSKFRSWYKWEEILKLSKLIGVLGRTGVDVENQYLCEHLITLDEKYRSVSATELRYMFSNMNHGFEAYEEYLISKVIRNEQK